MEFRFVDEHDPAALRRRRLQAERTQRWRQRQKQNIETTNHQAESSRTAEFAVENVQTRPENSFREDDDLGIIDAEPAYYDEESVDAYGAEEREDQTESGTPEVYAEVQADLLNGNTWSDLQHAT
ncbi:hypothetical protein CDV36_015330 [Fusarium kuroshium]|uniref:Uncharacterized protein n=2 Tax=Fusarium solani species complex TaxID=232080 RepID=A0A3M2RB36_9HYPO|nr:hypothetical protein CDV36_015330 [Fusarium kuroshium]RSL53049.1 hypothetical protein CEP51_014953 [Fusarium floridanum]